MRLQFFTAMGSKLFFFNKGLTISGTMPKLSDLVKSQVIKSKIMSIHSKKIKLS